MDWIWWAESIFGLHWGDWQVFDIHAALPLSLSPSPPTPHSQKARLSLNYRLQVLEPFRNNGWVILGRQWWRWLPLTHLLKRLMTYLPVYWHKQNISSLLMPRVSLALFFSFMCNVFCSVSLSRSLSVVVAKVRQAQWKKGGELEKRGWGGSKQISILPERPAKVCLGL